MFPADSMVCLLFYTQIYQSPHAHTPDLPLAPDSIVLLLTPFFHFHCHLVVITFLFFIDIFILCSRTTSARWIVTSDHHFSSTFFGTTLHASTSGPITRTCQQPPVLVALAASASMTSVKSPSKKHSKKSCSQPSGSPSILPLSAPPNVPSSLSLVMPASVQPSIPSHLSSGIPPSALSNSTMLSTMPSPVPTTSHALNNATMPSVPRLLQLEMHYILHL